MRLTLILTSIAAVSAMGLTGCSGSSGSTSEVTSAASAAALIGCTSSTPSDAAELFVTDQAECSLEGEKVRVFYFSTNDARNSFLELAGQFGGQYLEGENFLVEASPETLQRLQESVGGEIKP